MPTELKKTTSAKPKSPSQRIIDKAVNDAVEKALAEERYSYGKTKFTCQLCGAVVDVSKRKARAPFYNSSDPNNKIGYVTVCRDCIERMVYQINDDDPQKTRHNPTPESMKMALEYMDKPWLEKVYEASLNEVTDSSVSNRKSDVWNAYVKNVAMPQYNTMRWKDGDVYRTPMSLLLSAPIDELPKNQEILEQFEQNKSDALKLLGYEPFVQELPSDQPFLYSQLIGYLDSSTDANNDMMRVSSIIEIVKSYSHMEKINDIIASLMRDTTNLDKNISTVKALEETKSKITGNIQRLAQESCISLKNSKNATKGEDTWTGKIKKLKEMNLREAEVNAFDIGTCEGMRQVADISAASILKQIKLDENDYTEMLANQRILIDKYKKEADKCDEKARVLLRENVDLKTYMSELGIDFSEYLSSEPILDPIDVESTEVGDSSG